MGNGIEKVKKLMSIDRKPRVKMNINSGESSKERNTFFAAGMGILQIVMI